MKEDRMSSKVIAGRYEILQKIGDGGMAVVYESRDRLLNRYVAVKILKPEYSGDAKFIENFRKESHAAASLSHPNIVNIYDVGREGNINYIVMELVDGRPLSQIIEEEAPMDYRRVIEISKQVAAGLSAAHNHGIIHRDVKPHNILIGEDGIAKIADFGIAKAVSTTTIIDGTGSQVMGSVHYFSPEQAKGAAADYRSDIYSLGIVMYEMLTGEVPFDADNPVSVALMQINNEITPPSELVDGIPPSLERIVLKATRKDPAERFGSADEMIDALNDIEFVTRFVGSGAAYAASEEEEEEPPVKRKQGSRKKTALIIAIAAVLAVLAGLYFTGIIGGKIIAAPDITGKTVEEAQKVCDEYNIEVKVVDYEYNASYNADEICRQDPTAGSRVREGRSIEVTVSKGEEGTVPNIVGMDEDEAKKLIKKYGFKVGTKTVETSGEPKGTVIKQDPGAGEQTKPGSELNYTISDGKGKKKLEVPDVVGLSLPAAKQKITDAGFVVGTVSYAPSSTYSDGTVMAQQFKAGTKLEEKSTIDITVSTGSEGEINLDISYDEAKNSTFRMTVTVSDDNGTRNVVDHEIRNKSDGSETLRITGTGKGTIKVIFDTKTVYRYTVNFDTGTLE